MGAGDRRRGHDGRGNDGAATLQQLLDELGATSDWAALVTVLRRILAGERGEQLLAELDAVDTEIARETLHRLSDGQ